MGIIILEGEQRTDEWKAARLGVLTSSSCELILSPTQRKTFLTKILSEMLTGEQEPLPYSPHIEHGVKFEDEARRFYEIQKNVKVREVSFIFKDESKRIGTSPDGLVGEEGMLEIKCPSSKVHLSYITEDEVPKKYFYQMQHQMYVSGRKWVDFFSFDPRLPIEVRSYLKRVYRDEEAQEKIDTSSKIIIKAIDAFLTKHDLTFNK